MHRDMETPLEQYERHCREGEEQIAKQRAYIAGLLSGADDKQVESACRVLALLEARQRLCDELLKLERVVRR